MFAGPDGKYILFIIGIMKNMKITVTEKHTA